MAVEPKIFVLGDSRTGTTTLHKYFQALRLSSVHWFVKEAGQSSPPETESEANWIRLQSYIDSSGIRAFSDYPTRTFYKQLLDRYPEAYFILSTRRDVETWQKSMQGFFVEKHGRQINLAAKTESYERVNQKIRDAAALNPALKFLELCIDDDSAMNSETIKQFLGIQSAVQMGWENQTAHYGTGASRRQRVFFSPPPTDPIGYVEALCQGSETLPTESGWLFLINDRHSFLRHQFGLASLTSKDIEKAANVLIKRQANLRAQGANYLMFIMPEKSVVYREYLPIGFESLVQSTDRPAVAITSAARGAAHYLEGELRNNRSFGLTHFRGDTRTNWLGAFIVYRYIIEQCRTTNPEANLSVPMPLRRLKSEIVPHTGDLHAHVPEQYKKPLAIVSGPFAPGRGFEQVVKYVLEHQRSKPVETPSEYEAYSDPNPVIVMQQEDTSLPKAVVFRDSTADLMVDLLAEHFSRIVFVRHKGQILRGVIEQEKPDFVIQITAERLVSILHRQAAFA